jgi:hypothetical protein
MGATISSPTHVVRANALEFEGTWRLLPDALELQGGPTASADAVACFPYRDMMELRLSYSPSRIDHNRYRSDIRMRSGRRVAVLSTHYAGIADFEDRSATYVPLVRGLVARVAAENPQVKFRSGKRPLVYFAEHLFLLAMVALLVFVLSITGVTYLSDSSWARVAIIVGFIPLLVLYTRKNWPRTFAPDAIPPDVLPECPG